MRNPPLSFGLSCSVAAPRESDAWERAKSAARWQDGPLRLQLFRRRFAWLAIIFCLVPFTLLALLAARAAGETLSAERSAASGFAAAEEAWHRQRWDEAVAGFRQAAALAADDDVGLDAQLHYAEALSFLTAPEVAIAEYDGLIRRAPGSPFAHEAKCGIAALKYWLGELNEAKALFLEVARDTRDWAMLKECVARLKHLQRLIDLAEHHPGLRARDCGPKALEDFCRLKGVELPEAEMTRLLPVGPDGVHMEAVRRAARAKGFRLVGARLTPDQLSSSSKPFIAYLRNRHYAVVLDTRGNRIDFIDPHGRETYTTTNRFHVLWDGMALVPEGGVANLRREQLLSSAAMERLFGGHHLHGTEDGACEENPASGCDGNSGHCGGDAPAGQPKWQVNLANYNFLIRDLVFRYDGLGPTIEFWLTYSADSAIVSAFGRSWTHSYNVFLTENPNGVDVRRGGAKVDHFVSRGDGTYTPPLWNYDDLRKDTNAGTYTLRIKRTKEVQHFDVSGRLTSIEDRNGHAVTFQYEGDRIETITDAVGRVTSLQYHPNGLVAAVIDPLGRIARYEYDANNDLVTYIDMATNVISYAYDAVGYLTSFSTPSGTWQVRRGTTPNFTDLPYILREVVDPLGHTRRYDSGPTIAWYDDERTNRWFVFSEDEGETTQFTDPLGNKWLKNYFRGNPSSFTDPEGRRAFYDYDDRGNLVSARPPGGAPLTVEPFAFTFDNRDNLTNRSVELGRTSRYSYDTSDNLTSVVDAKGHVTRFDYDSRGLLTSIIDPRGNVTRFDRDARGQATAITNAFGGVTRFTYDDVGRVRALTDPKGQEFTYTVDPLDRVTRVESPDGLSRTLTYACCSLTAILDATGTVGFDVDALGRLRHFTNNFGRIISYEYDPAGNLTKLTYPGDKVVNYDYDAANRLVRVTDWLNNTTGYVYDRSGRLLASTNSNGTLTRYHYDNGGRLRGLSDQAANGEIIIAHQFGADQLGNFTNVTTVGGLAPQFTKIEADYTFGADNRIAEGAGVTFVHDPNGNLTGISGTPATTLVYDALDRLTSIERGAYSTQYAYNALGQRVARTVNGVTTRFVIDPAAYFSRVLMETDPAGNPTAYYVHGLGLIARITPDGQTYTYHYDWRGSTVALTDAASAVVNRYVYDAWGNLGTNSFETVVNPFRFVGRLGVMDEGNGLFYMRARYYLPELGRFASKDPVGTLGGPNFYAYAMNDPLGLMDPLGLWYVDVGGSFGLGLGRGVVGGFFVGPDGVHPYAGSGLMAPGPGASIMWSPGSPSPGCWSTQVAGGYGLGAAVGYSGGSSDWQVGLTTPGASVATYYTW